LAGINAYGSPCLSLAGLNEQQGASFEAQTLAVMKHVEKYWSDTYDKQMWFS
jgi:hypothetical protein